MQHGVDSDMLFMSQLGIPKTKPLHIQPIQGSQEILYNISYPAMDAAAEAFFKADGPRFLSRSSNS